MQNLGRIGVLGYMLIALGAVVMIVAFLTSYISANPLETTTIPFVVALTSSELDSIGTALAGACWLLLGRKVGKRAFTYMGLAILISLPFQWSIVFYEVFGLPFLYVNSYPAAITFDPVFSDLTRIVGPALFVAVPIGLWISDRTFDERIFRWASTASVAYLIIHFSPLAQLVIVYSSYLTSALLGALLLLSYSTLAGMALARVSRRELRGWDGLPEALDVRASSSSDSRPSQ